MLGEATSQQSNLVNAKTAEDGGGKNSLSAVLRELRV
jgi:hypothetical protein